MEKFKNFANCIFFLALSACGSHDPNVAAELDYEDFIKSESEAKRSYDSSLVRLTGRVLGENSRPLEGVTVSVQDLFLETNASGFFAFNVRRENALIQFKKNNYYSEKRPVHLQVAFDDKKVDFGNLTLRLKKTESTRLFFGGDTTFARRMLDPTGLTPFDQMPTNNPEAHIQVEDPLPGSIKALEHVKSLFESPDYRVLNLESPIITDPSTVHPTKDYSFFTLPESLDALKIHGIDYVSLGNNHVYDYLESGVLQTMRYISDYGIPNSGLGRNTKEAFKPHVSLVKQHRLSMISVNTISGDKHDINYVATDHKGGAADGRLHGELQKVIDEAKFYNQHPIVQYHTGDEYTFKPSPFAHANMRRSITMGASMVIAHHPHVAQGFEWYKGKFIAHSLGNFLLDQLRLETMMGVAVELDYERDNVDAGTGIPVYLEDYKPRLIGGRLNTNLINRLSEKSISAKVYAQGGRAKILRPDQDFVLSKRQITLNVNIDSSGCGHIDLRNHLKGSEYLMGVQSANLKFKIGRDILEHGDFEDYDIDDDRFELSRWDVTSEDRFSCHQAAYRGARGACLIRRYYNKSPTVLAFRNSVRVIGDALDKPNKDLSFLAYVKGKNSGPIDIYAKYTSSKGANPYGQESLFQASSLNSDAWTPIFKKLNIPQDVSNVPKQPTVNARALRVFFKHSSPKEGGGMLMVDEAAVISWDQGDLNHAMNKKTLSGPNQIQFLKALGKEGSHKVTLNLSTVRGYKAAQ